MNKRHYVKRFDSNPDLACYCRSGRKFGDCCGSAEADRLAPRGLREYALPQFGSFDWFETPYLLRYKVGGRYGVHADADQLDPATGEVYRAADRDISALFYLNDDYEGGELTFTHLNFTFNPQVGDFVIFPSGIMFKHQSHTIRSGRKYVLASWASLRSSPKLFPQASHSPRIKF